MTTYIDFGRNKKIRPAHRAIIYAKPVNKFVADEQNLINITQDYKLTAKYRPKLHAMIVNDLYEDMEQTLLNDVRVHFVVWCMSFEFNEEPDYVFRSSPEERSEMIVKLDPCDTDLNQMIRETINIDSETNISVISRTRDFVMFRVEISNECAEHLKTFSCVEFVASSEESAFL